MNRDDFKLSRSQRMQLKAFVCLLGVLLIILLLLGKLIGAFLHREEPEEPESSTPPHVPVVETLHNVWIMEEDEEGILIFREGERERYPWGEINGASGAESRFDGEGQSHAEGEVGGADGSGAVEGYGGGDQSDAGSRLEEGQQDTGQRYRPGTAVREQVADVTLTDGQVTEIYVMAEKINGKILGAGEDWIEVEGYGRLPLAADYRGYRLYDSLEMCTARDIRFGYSFTDLCLEDGEICGVLLVKEEAMEYIRVLVRSAENGSLHTQPVLTADTGFSVIYGSYEDRKTEVHQAGEEILFAADSPYFEGERVWVVPDVLTGKVTLKSEERSQGTPSYRGTMELLRTEGGIAVINQVLLEEYLYSVVPSEMPSKYPAEALKAQAVCARTYAYGHMEHAGFPQYGAHVDDSTSYQVYNNILEQESTTTAVKETYGQLLYTAENTLAGTYYYSTSCGVGSDANVWKTEAASRITYLHARHLSKTTMAQVLADGTEPEELGEKLREEEAFAAFIRSENQDDFEVEEGWYRWSYEVEELDPEYMLEILKKRYAANSRLVLTLKDGEYVSEEIGGLGEIRELCIAKRGAGGVADELIIEAEKGTYKVITEHNIRYVLNNGESRIVRKDGSKVKCPTILPSGFFVITAGKEDGNVVGYTLTGGGFGHGVGMSQNGARSMAKSGWSAGDILAFFYEGCTVKNIYE